MKTALKSILAFLVAAVLLTAAALPVFAETPAADDCCTDAYDVDCCTVPNNDDCCNDAVPVSAAASAAEAEEAETGSPSVKAIAAAVAVGLTATVGAVCMGWGIVRAVQSIARQPEAEGGIRTTLTLGLVFIETTIIYALVIAILIIFVL